MTQLEKFQKLLKDHDVTYNFKYCKFTVDYENKIIYVEWWWSMRWATIIRKLFNKD